MDRGGGSLLGPREAIVQTVSDLLRGGGGGGDIGMPAAMAAAGAQRLDEELAEKAQRTAEEEGAALATARGCAPRRGGAGARDTSATP